MQLPLKTQLRERGAASVGAVCKKADKRERARMLFVDIVFSRILMIYFGYILNPSVLNHTVTLCKEEVGFRGFLETICHQFVSLKSMKQGKFFKVRVGIVLGAIAAVLIFFFKQPVMIQRQDYHLFVDTRSFLGIPNAIDVVSNIFFLITGGLGVWEIIQRQTTLMTKKSWFWFFLSVLLIAPGSAYYHLSPNDSTLVWDRLPMSMAFMAMYIVLLCEHIEMRFEKGLYPALLVGVLSVLTWWISADLRFYFLVQFSSFITIPLILVLFKSHYTLKIYYFFSLLLYGLAKWAEMKDKEVFEATHYAFSGHSLKHFLAALGLLCLWWMIRSRKSSLNE